MALSAAHPLGMVQKMAAVFASILIPSDHAQLWVILRLHLVYGTETSQVVYRRKRRLLGRMPRRHVWVQGHRPWGMAIQFFTTFLSSLRCHNSAASYLSFLLALALSPLLALSLSHSPSLPLSLACSLTPSLCLSLSLSFGAFPGLEDGDGHGEGPADGRAEGRGPHNAAASAVENDTLNPPKKARRKRKLRRVGL